MPSCESDESDEPVSPESFSSALSIPSELPVPAAASTEAESSEEDRFSSLVSTGEAALDELQLADSVRANALSKLPIHEPVTGETASVMASRTAVTACMVLLLSFLI